MAELHEDDPPEHLSADVAALLAADPRVNELGVEVSVEGGRVLVRGEVATPERQGAISAVLAEHLGAELVSNQVTVASMDEPTAMEQLG